MLYFINITAYQYGSFICSVTAGTLSPTAVTRETKRHPKPIHLQNPIDDSREKQTIGINEKH